MRIRFLFLFSYNNHSDKCEISHGGFDLHLISDVEHLFMYLLALYRSSLGKCLFRSSAHFLVSLFFFFCFAIELYEFFILDVSPLSDDLQIFSPILFILFMVKNVLRRGIWQRTLDI